MRRYFIGTLIAIVILIAVLITVVPAMLKTDEESAAGPIEQTEVPSRPDCGGQTVAGVELPCLGSRETASGEISQSHVTVVNVWAWWCEPCRNELPIIEQYRLEHPEYAVVGVHADSQSVSGAQLLESLGLGLPSFQDSTGKFAGNLGLPGVVPITLIIKDGAVLETKTQPITSVAELDQAVKGALAA